MLGILAKQMKVATNEAAESIIAQKVIQESDYKGNWPFTVEKGVLYLLKKKAVVFYAGGQLYAINGRANGLGFAAIEPIWKKDNKMTEVVKDAMGKHITKKFHHPPIRTETGEIIHYRVPISPIIRLGLSLGEENGK